MTDDELLEMCRRWQKHLRLQDWDVAIRFADLYDLEGGNRAGQVEWFIEKKCALIDVARPGELKPNSVWPQDTEITVVHELLHLWFAPFKTQADTPEDEAEEQAVHALSCAFVNLSRQAEQSGTVLAQVPQAVETAKGKKKAKKIRE